MRAVICATAALASSASWAAYSALGSRPRPGPGRHGNVPVRHDSGTASGGTVVDEILIGVLINGLAQVQAGLNR
jgi:hypothetical protein